MPDRVEFSGEVYALEGREELIIGRGGDVAIDDNPYLHRHFLLLKRIESLWWLVNIGSQLSATVSDVDGTMEAYLAPNARLPIVFATTVVRFSAASTTYELMIEIESAVFEAPWTSAMPTGGTTTGVPSLNLEQRLLLLALTEPILRSGKHSVGTLPSSADAAARLGWPLTRFNRKLDYLCQKLSKLGVRGLHGGPSKLASNRRFRLAEYALAARLVTSDELSLLEEANVGDPAVGEL